MFSLHNQFIFTNNVCNNQYGDSTLYKMLPLPGHVICLLDIISIVS